MKKLEALKTAVSKLAPDELARFRAWFAEFDAARFDKEVEADPRSGKLDGLAAAAVADFKKGRVRGL